MSLESRLAETQDTVTRYEGEIRQMERDLAELKWLLRESKDSVAYLQRAIAKRDGK